MSAPYSVDLGALADTIAALARCEASCDAGLDQVSTQVRALHGTWTGRTAGAQAEAQRRWEAGFAQMREGLAQMRNAAAVAKGNYQGAVEANLRMWAL